MHAGKPSERRKTANNFFFAKIRRFVHLFDYLCLCTQKNNPLFSFFQHNKQVLRGIFSVQNLSQIYSSTGRHHALHAHHNSPQPQRVTSIVQGCLPPGQDLRSELPTPRSP